jgi:hypothetical protein
MSSCCKAGRPPHATEPSSLTWRTVFARAADRMRASIARRKQRRELHDYLASDYRAAADIGVRNYYDDRDLQE